MTDTVIAEWQKNSTEFVRVSLNEFKSRNLVDVRVFVPKADGGMVATPKGVTLLIEQLPQLIAALQKAEAQAIASGLLVKAPAEARAA